MIQFEMELANAGKVPVSALVDTGAEVNLVRRDLVPAEFFRKADKPIRFMAANQTLVSGGQQELVGALLVQGADPDLGTPSTITFPIVCFDADIGVDLILSYEWMASMGMDVIPRKHGLMVHGDGTMLWVPGIRESQPYKLPFASVCVVDRPFSEEYSVRPDYFTEIVRQFGVSPTVDIFGTSSNALCTRFGQPPVVGGVQTEKWPKDEILWLHPPPAQGPEVEAKLARSECAAIVVIPAWDKPWVRRLLAMSSRRIYFDKGSRIFKSRIYPLRETPWPVWALKIEKGLRKIQDPPDKIPKCSFYPSWKAPATVEPSVPSVSPVVSASEQASAILPKGNVPRMLDLFCGTGSVGDVFRQFGYEVTSVDIDARFEPDIVADVLDWDYKSQFEPGHFEVIFCSPPCAQFSRARTTAPRDLFEGDALVLKALEIIRYLRPERWFMENPRTGHLPKRPYMVNIAYVDVDYCQFSEWGYQKPTRI